MPPILYDVVIEGDFTPERINWGDDPGWADRLRDKLGSAHRIGLVPKAIAPSLPVASVELGEGRRWILFSRVYRRMAPPVSMRVYCIGWQVTTGGSNVKALLWLYPNGVVEISDEPVHWKEILGAYAQFENQRVDGS